MAKKSDPPPAPDYTPLVNASKEASQLQFQTSKEQLAWAREQYERDSALSKTVTDRMLRTQDENDANARKDRQRYEQVFQPLEDKLAQDANDYANPERKDLERGRAMSGVAQNFDSARDNAERQLQSYGLNPGAVRYAALDIGLQAQRAAAQAAAANQSDQVVDATGRALRSEAINVGRGYPGQIAGQYGVGLQAGAGGLNGALATTGSGANTMGTGMQWAGAGNQSLGTAGSLQNMGFNNSLESWKAQQQNSTGAGMMLGMLGGAALGKMKPWGFWADGGAVDDPAAMQGAPMQGASMPADPNSTPGGPVPLHASPSGGRAIDDVNAKLTAGEFVIPKDVTEWYGEQKLQKMIEQARQQKQGAGAKPSVGPASSGPTAFASRPGAIPTR